LAASAPDYSVASRSIRNATYRICVLLFLRKFEKKLRFWQIIKKGKIIIFFAHPKHRRGRDQTQVPKAKTQVPKAKTPVPKAKTQVPKAKTQVPKAKTPVPKAKTQVPKAKTQVPKAKTQVPNLSFWDLRLSFWTGVLAVTVGSQCARLFCRFAVNTKCDISNLCVASFLRKFVKKPRFWQIIKG
jgi:hypothetical protein